MRDTARDPRRTFTLTGWGSDVDGVLEAVAPRRMVLDKVLVDAAAEQAAQAT
jgi:hypothetical protein